MSRYKRRIIMASIALHVIGLLAYFVYWINTDPFKKPEKVTTSQSSSNTLAEGEKNEQSGETEKIPDTGKNPYLDYEDGDLADKKIAGLIENSINKNENLTTAEKVDNLNKELQGISRTPVKEVEKMTNLAEKVFGVKKEEESTNPIREAKPGEKLDVNSLKLYDFKLENEMITLIYKDKNNLLLIGQPEKFNEMDPDMRMRINLMQKAKENKKFKLLLDSANSILDKLQPKESENSNSN